MQRMCAICQRRESRWSTDDPKRCGFCAFAFEASAGNSKSATSSFNPPDGCRALRIDGRWDFFASEYRGHGLQHLAAAAFAVGLLLPLIVILVFMGKVVIEASRGAGNADPGLFLLCVLLLIPACFFGIAGWLILRYVLWLSERRVLVSVYADTIRVFEGLQKSRPKCEGRRTSTTMCDLDWEVTHSGGDWTVNVTTEPPIRFARDLPRERLLWMCQAISDALDGTISAEKLNSISHSGGG